MADVHAGKRVAKKASMTLEERNVRAIRAKRRFRALVRSVIANRPWLEEVVDEELGENVKRNVQVLTKKKDKKSLLSIQHKAILNKPAEFRTDSEKLLLYRIIGGLSCFRKYPEHVKIKLASVTYFYYFGPGRVIVRQKQQAYALYFIVTGEVTVSITSFDPVLNEAVTIVVGTMVPGNMFGEVSLLHDIPRTATITTATPCELLCVKRADFDIVLKSSIEAQWAEIQRAMKKFSYFDGWDVVAVRECCILAKKKKYAANETILGDGVGADKCVHFLVKGKCRVIEHLLVSSSYDARGKKHYKLYTPPVEAPLEKDIIMSRKGPKSVSMAQMNDNSNSEFDEEDDGSLVEELPPLFNSKQSLHRSVSRIDKAFSANVGISIPPGDSTLGNTAKKKIKPKLSCVSFPKNVETFFMQVCVFSETACFNLGENMRKRRIVAITDVECMVIPKYWIWQRNKGNIWTRIQQFLDSRIPTTQAVFNQFLEARKWRNYKKQLLNSILPYPAANLINNVPYSIRLNEDFEFAEKF